MAARNEDRNQDRHDAPYDARDAYDGMDALMAAITDEPLPEGALDDTAFAAEHRSALADVALLREQLGLIGHALAGDPLTAPGTEAEAVDPAGRPMAARPAPGTQGTSRPAQETGPETEPTSASTPPVKPRAASARSARPARTRPRRRRPAALALAFGTLAAAVTASAVVGLGWLISQGGAGASAGSDSASSSEKHASTAEDAAGTQDGLAYVACARLIVEGTVAGLEPAPGTGLSRVTLDVERYYKPDKGDDEVVFPVEDAEASHLREGEPVLIGVHRDEATPDLLVTGEKRIAQERSRIESAVPGAESMQCE
ncbi:hypothetical protein [Streptomyces bluensis]|uniref:hypothetical protein n=1 Tax=Streptomyces bluensis TaxID=33897 RepID=UPI00332EDA82